MVQFRDVYDVTARQRKIIEEKAARRLELRNEYLKKYLNPYKPVGGHMFDEPIQRLISLRETRIEFNKPTFMGWLAHIGLVVIPIVVMIMAVKHEREKTGSKQILLNQRNRHTHDVSMPTLASSSDC